MNAEAMGERGDEVGDGGGWMESVSDVKETRRVKGNWMAGRSDSSKNDRYLRRDGKICLMCQAEERGAIEEQ